MRCVALFIVASCVTSYALRVKRQSKTPEVIPIISFENIQNQDGSYQFSYLTGHGISVSEEGRPKNLTVRDEKGQETPGIGMSAKGAYSYPSPEGGEVSVVWTADENGFRPRVTFRARGGKAEPEPATT